MLPQFIFELSREYKLPARKDNFLQVWQHLKQVIPENEDQAYVFRKYCITYKYFIEKILFLQKEYSEFSAICKCLTEKSSKRNILNNKG